MVHGLAMIPTLAGADTLGTNIGVQGVGVTSVGARVIEGWCTASR